LAFSFKQNVDFSFVFAGVWNKYLALLIWIILFIFVVDSRLLFADMPIFIEDHDQISSCSVPVDKVKSASFHNVSELTALLIDKLNNKKTLFILDFRQINLGFVNFVGVIMLQFHGTLIGRVNSHK